MLDDFILHFVDLPLKLDAPTAFRGRASSTTHSRAIVTHNKPGAKIAITVAQWESCLPTSNRPSPFPRELHDCVENTCLQILELISP